MSKQSYNFRINLGTNQNGSFYIPLSTNQPVKRIGFNFSYEIKADDNVAYIINCENVNNEIVGLLNKFSRIAGGHVYSIDGLQTDNEIISYYDNKLINGNFKFNYKQDINGVTIDSCNILVLINLYF